MFGLKGSRRGSYPGSLQRYMSHQEEISICSKCGYHDCQCHIKTNNKQDEFGKDLKELIKKTEGKPEWTELRSELLKII